MEETLLPLLSGLGVGLLLRAPGSCRASDVHGAHDMTDHRTLTVRLVLRACETRADLLERVTGIEPA
ncbi:MAG: hypothetical protein ACJ73V_08470, partial [Acidimicrobiia bacterium]